MYEEFKKLIKNKILLAVISIILGVILIVRQRSAIDSLVWVFGIILLISAAAFLILFIGRKDKHASALILAIICFIIGLLFVVKPGLIVNIFPILDRKSVV